MNTATQVVEDPGSLVLVKSDTSSPKAIIEPEPDHYTDVGNAKRLVKCHGENLRFCYRWNSWLVWDGSRWVKDEKGSVIKKAKETVQAMYAEASKVANGLNREALANHALNSEAACRINAMIKLAESEIPISPDELDSDPWLLNVENGFWDLRTGELNPHERSHLITKLSPVIYDPDAKCPRWEKFLETIIPDYPIREFLQRAVGSSLTGIAQDKAMFILWGSGDNGKTVFIETIREILGDYAINAPVETFLAKKTSGIPNDVARLRGARFVTAQESDQGRSLNEGLVKAMTGGDTMTARLLYSEFFDFRPEFKPFLSTNHKPIIRDTNDGIWNRIKLIPFSVTIAKDKQDAGLRETLRAELPGILNWAVEGCMKWQKRGLVMPEEIREATDRYREDMDLLKDFLSDCCDKGEKALLKSMYLAYGNWCELNGENPIKKRAFSALLKQRGYECRKGTGNKDYVFGLALDSLALKQ